MRFAFVHTADWQIGKRFGAFPAEKAAVLREERLRAVDRVAEAARVGGAATVLVAGDVFDSETVSDAIIGTLLARLKAHPKLSWHLLPGNHDPARAGGVWEAIVSAGLPANVTVHTEPRAAAIASGVVLLPAPLTAKSTSRDPTQWMDEAPTPAGTLRIGFAHGSVQGFGSGGEANVPIEPARVTSAQLSYLALGDWHGTTRISERAWYSGTPEPDGFRDNEPGNALLVTVEDARAAPKVERVSTAHFTWARRQQSVDGTKGLEIVEGEVANLGSAASRWLIDLSLDGHVTLSQRAAIEAQLAQLATEVFHLGTDLGGLHVAAAASDLDALGGGALGTVAQRLRSAAESGGAESEAAERALRKLFALARRAQAGGAA
jgi:DNA repair exonuclease SbcCD nuclease subunit